MNRIIVAIGLAFVVAIAYVISSSYLLAEIDYKGQAALVAISAFSCATSAGLLWDMSHFGDDDFGALKNERSSLIIGLIFVCIYVPLSIGSSFIEVFKAAGHIEKTVIERRAGSDRISNSSADNAAP